MQINNIQNINFGKIYKVTSNTKNPNPKMVNQDVFEAVMDARGTISGQRKKEPKDELASRGLGEFLKAQIVDWDGRVNGIALGHLKGSDYMFTGEDAERFFKYRKESREITPNGMLYEKGREFLGNLKRSRNVLNEKIRDYTARIDLMTVTSKDDETRKNHLIRKREQYMGELKVIENHIDSLEKALKDEKYVYQAAYQWGKQETLVESGDFDEIAFRFGEYGKINSVEVINKSKAEQE